MKWSESESGAKSEFHFPSNGEPCTDKEECEITTVVSNDPLKLDQTISSVSGIKSADHNEYQRSDSASDFGDERIDPLEMISWLLMK